MSTGARRTLRIATITLAAALMVAGGWLLGRQGYLKAKALLAERLIARSLQAHLLDGQAHRPWSWADIHPVAELQVERLGVRRAVLTGATGSSLAFGLGHVHGTAAPGERGNCVVAGHRDSWAEFLQELRVGDVLTLTSRAGVRRYRVQATQVVPINAGAVLARSSTQRLTLVTCWPFGGLTRSTRRYVVRAAAIA